MTTSSMPLFGSNICATITSTDSLLYENIKNIVCLLVGHSIGWEMFLPAAENAFTGPYSRAGGTRTNGGNYRGRTGNRGSRTGCRTGGSRNRCWTGSHSSRTGTATWRRRAFGGRAKSFGGNYWYGSGPIFYLLPQATWAGSLPPEKTLLMF